MKRLWILVGGNGAGKSTFYKLKLKPLGLPFINADDIAREVYPEDPEGNSYNAALIGESTRSDLIQQGTRECPENCVNARDTLKVSRYPLTKFDTKPV